MSDKNIRILLDKLTINLKSRRGVYPILEKKQNSIEKLAPSKSKFSNDSVQEKLLIIKQDYSAISDFFRTINDSILDLYKKLKQLDDSSEFLSYLEEILSSVTLFESSIESQSENIGSLSDLINQKQPSEKRRNFLITNELYTPNSRLKKLNLFSELKFSKFQNPEEENQLVQKGNNGPDKPSQILENDEKSDGIENDKNPGLEETKIIDALKEENLKLKFIISEYEEKEMSYLEAKSQLDSWKIEKSYLSTQLEEAQKKLAEKDLKIKQVLKALEENSLEKKKKFESIFDLKEELEARSCELEIRNSALQDENNEKELMIQEKDYLIKSLEKEKKEMIRHNEEIINKFEVQLNKYIENEEASKEGFRNPQDLLDIINQKEQEAEIIKQKYYELEKKMKDKEIKCESLSKSLQEAEAKYFDSKLKLNSLFKELEDVNNSKKIETRESDEALLSDIQKKLEFSESQNSVYLDQIESLKLSLEVYKRKLEESQKQVNEYVHQVYDLRSSLDLYKQQIENIQQRNSELTTWQKSIESSLSLNEKQLQEFESLLAERDSIIVSLKSNSKNEEDIFSLRKSIELMEHENRSLIESNSFISDYATNLKSSVNELNLKLENSEKRVKELEGILKKDSPRKEIKSSKIVQPSKILNRDSRIDAGKIVKESIEKSKEFSLELFENIGIELNEESPQMFIDRIAEIKKQRDFYYASSVKYKEVVNRLKEELKESDDSKLIARVVSLKRKQ